MSKDIWITKSGEKIAVSDMTDCHLLNTHKFMVNWYVALSGIDGDRETAGVSMFAVALWVEAFEDEIAKRELDPLVEREWNQWYD